MAFRTERYQTSKETVILYMFGYKGGCARRGHEFAAPLAIGDAPRTPPATFLARTVWTLIDQTFQTQWTIGKQTKQPRGTMMLRGLKRQRRYPAPIEIGKAPGRERVGKN